MVGMKDMMNDEWMMSCSHESYFNQDGFEKDNAYKSFSL